MKKRLELDDQGQLDGLTIRQRAGTTTFRFWQEGPGYDRNVTSESGLLESIDYLHRNPVRRGLCGTAEDWIWSSSRWHLSDRLEIDRRLPTLTRLPAGFFHFGAKGSVEM
jgi:putative transposase